VSSFGLVVLRIAGRRDGLQAGISGFDIDAACQFHGDNGWRWEVAAIYGTAPRPRAIPDELGC